MRAKQAKVLKYWKCNFQIYCLYQFRGCQWKILTRRAREFRFDLPATFPWVCIVVRRTFCCFGCFFLTVHEPNVESFSMRLGVRFEFKVVGVVEGERSSGGNWAPLGLELSHWQKKEQKKTIFPGCGGSLKLLPLGAPHRWAHMQQNSNTDSLTHIDRIIHFLKAKLNFRQVWRPPEPSPRQHPAAGLLWTCFLRSASWNASTPCDPTWAQRG